MENICENCGAELKEGAYFCQECGSAVSAPTEDDEINFCTNCGKEISPEETFCGECGKKLSEPEKPKNDNKKVLIIFGAILGVLLIAAIFFMATSTHDVELETYDFGYVTMLAPVGSHFSEYDSVGKGTDYWAIGYENSLEDDSTLYMVWIANYDGTNSGIHKYIESEGDLDIYQFEYENSYVIQRHTGGYYIQVAGFDDLDTLKEIAHSIKVEKPITNRIN